ncbi:hypothetical protein BH09ACT3_BH09ACT3_12340 [soil metagenome]
MMQGAFGLHGTPEIVHSDGGPSMTSKTVRSLLADLGVTVPRSRPHVSNDNPYSEALFKTMKYLPVFPDRFGSLTEAREFLGEFVHAYNHHHRTPGSACTLPPTSTTATPTPSTGAATGGGRVVVPAPHRHRSPE